MRKGCIRKGGLWRTLTCCLEVLGHSRSQQERSKVSLLSPSTNAIDHLATRHHFSPIHQSCILNSTA